MSRTIPSCISPDIKSNAGKKIFDWFKGNDGAENRVILHFPGIFRRIRFIYGRTRSEQTMLLLKEMRK
jgi:hypothetical protein